MIFDILTSWTKTVFSKSKKLFWKVKTPLFTTNTRFWTGPKTPKRGFWSRTWDFYVGSKTGQKPCFDMSKHDFSWKNDVFSCFFMFFHFLEFLKNLKKTSKTVKKWKKGVFPLFPRHILKTLFLTCFWPSFWRGFWGFWTSPETSKTG